MQVIKTKNFYLVDRLVLSDDIYAAGLDILEWGENDTVSFRKFDRYSSFIAIKNGRLRVSKVLPILTIECYSAELASDIEVYAENIRQMLLGIRFVDWEDDLSIIRPTGDEKVSVFRFEPVKPEGGQNAHCKN